MSVLGTCGLTNVAISRLGILYWKPGFQVESLVKVSLMSNSSGTSKIHFVVVFVDIAGNLWVMVEHRNNPFVFCNPSFQWSFSLTIAYKPAVMLVQLILYTDYHYSIFNYIIIKDILTFWLVLSYDLLEDRCTIDVIITKFFPLPF